MFNVFDAIEVRRLQRIPAFITVSIRPSENRRRQIITIEMTDKPKRILMLRPFEESEYFSLTAIVETRCSFRYCKFRG